MTTLTKILLAVIAFGTAQIASAFNYTNGNLLLVFRQDPPGNYDDITFNLGPVSKYLSLAPGTTVPVTNFSLSVVTNYFGGVSGVQFLLMAGDDSTVWLTDANLSVTPTAMTYSKWSLVQGKISSIGLKATANTASNSITYYQVPSSDLSSYTYIATGGNIQTRNPATMAGDAPIVLQSAAPASLAFYELTFSSTTPKPAAPRIGTFTLSANGQLSFTAASSAPLQQPSITRIIRSGSLTTVYFTTVPNQNYSLRYKTTVTGGWNPLAGTVAGDGSVKNLTDTTTDGMRFYSVQSNY